MEVTLKDLLGQNAHFLREDVLVQDVLPDRPTASKTEDVKQNSTISKTTSTNSPACLPFGSGNPMTADSMRYDSPLSWQDWKAIPRLHEWVHERAETRVNPDVSDGLADLQTRQKLGRDV